MKNRSVISRVLVTVLFITGLTVLSSDAVAQSSQIGWYVEGSVGLWILNDAQSKCDDFEKAFASFNPTCTIDDKGAAFELGGGIRIGEYFEFGGRFDWIE